MSTKADVLAMQDDAPDVLSIFMEGTANTIDPVTTQIGEFFNLVEARDEGQP